MIKKSKYINILNQGKYKKALPEISVYAKNKDYKLIHFVYQTSDEILYIEFVECDTAYNIIITSNSQLDQNGFIEVSSIKLIQNHLFTTNNYFPQIIRFIIITTISSFDVRPLFPKLKYMQSEKLFETTYWQLSFIEHMTIFYDFQFCGGLFQVFLSSDLEKLRNGQYEIQIQTEANRFVQGYLQLVTQIFDNHLNNSIFGGLFPHFKIGIIFQCQIYFKIEKIKISVVNLEKYLSEDVYFKITPYKILNKEAQQPSYTMRILYVSDETQFSYKDIHPGEYGELQYSIQQSSDNVTLFVTFAQLNYTNQVNYSIEKVEYYLRVKERDEMDDERFNYCESNNEGIKIIYDQFNKSKQITLLTELNNEKNLRQNNYVITVLAKAHIILQDEQKLTLDYYYDSKHVRWNNDIDSGFNYYLLVAIIIVIFLALLILIKYIKGRRNDKYDFTENQTQLNQEIELNYRGMQN